MKRRVLVAVDEPALRARLVQVLQSCDYVASFHRSESDNPRGLRAAIVAPTSLDDKGLARARELCAAGYRLIVVTDSRESARAVLRLLPDAEGVLWQPIEEAKLAHLLAEIAGANASEGTPSPRVLQFEGRLLDLGGRALIDANGREVPLTHAEFELLALFARSSGRVLSRQGRSRSVPRLSLARL